MSDEERSLVIPAGGLPALLTGGGKGGVNVRPTTVGLRIPNLTLIHKVETREEMEKGFVPGYWRYGEATILTNPVAIVLRIDEVRRYSVNDPVTKKIRTVCASVDGAMPWERVEEPIHENCARCQYGHWRTDKTRTKADGKYMRIPPACNEGFGFLGLLPDLKFAPFWFVVFRTQARAVQPFVGSIMQDPESRQVHELAIKFGSKGTENTQGARWYLPALEIVDRIPPTYFAEAASYAAAQTWQPYVGVTDDVDEGEAAPAAGGPAGAAAPTRAPEAGPQDMSEVPF